MNRMIGVNSNCYHGYSIEAAIDGISAAGFRYIELTATKGWTEHVFPDQKFLELQSLKNRLKAAGLKPFAMSGHCNLMDPERLQDFIVNIQLAAFYGCGYIVSSVGEAHLKDRTMGTNREAAENITALLPYLKEYNMKLVLETHGAHGTGAAMKELVDLIDSEWVSINYDTGNVIFYGNGDIKEDLSACIDQVGYFHLKDKKGGVGEWNFPGLGEGGIDFPMIFDLLDQNGNNSPFSIEIEFTREGPRNLEEINRAVKASGEYLKACGFTI